MQTNSVTSITYIHVRNLVFDRTKRTITRDTRYK